MTAAFDHVNETLARLAQARGVLKVINDDCEAGEFDRLSASDIQNLLWTVDTLLEQGQDFAWQALTWQTRPRATV